MKYDVLFDESNGYCTIVLLDNDGLRISEDNLDIDESLTKERIEAEVLELEKQYQESFAAKQAEEVAKEDARLVRVAKTQELKSLFTEGVKKVSDLKK